ncbi:MAG: TIGR03862 family flavoprotein [Beijerinckiaceae bacterium]
MLTSSPAAAIVGAGPAGLMAAEVLAQGGAKVTIYDRMASPGRKLLLAGRGGLNLTHSEPLETLLTRYGEAAPRLRRAITAFSPAMLRDWCDGLGQQTFVGSSGRVFPKAFKASPLLRAWLRRLAAQGVTFVPRHRWIGFGEGNSLCFETPNGPATYTADASVLALGGASWPHLGSDGRWTRAMAKANILTLPLRPANCGFLIAWSEVFKSRFEGQPLKGIALAFGDLRGRGEAVITRNGIEGGGIYALSAPLREAILKDGEAILHIALRAEFTQRELEKKLSGPRGKQSLSTFLRKVLKLSPVAIGLLHEASRAQSLALTSTSAAELAKFIASVPLRLTGIAPIARAISTAGGIAFSEIDEDFMLTRRPGAFVAGEMLDWEAPTGGYLLQACFSTGAAAGRGALAWLARHQISGNT